MLKNDIFLFSFISTNQMIFTCAFEFIRKEISHTHFNVNDMQNNLLLNKILYWIEEKSVES